MKPLVTLSGLLPCTDYLFTVAVSDPLMGLGFMAKMETITTGYLLVHIYLA